MKKWMIKNKINKLENNQRNFKRENDQANSTHQRLIKEFKKMESEKIKNQKCNFDQVKL